MKSTLELLQIYTMTEQREHPTAGRRRRHKSPASIPLHDLPLPRLVDHMAAEDGPSGAEEEEKEVKRYRSAPTTPRSTSGTLSHDYDMVIGLAPVETHESARFEEGSNSHFQDAQENTGTSPDDHNKTSEDTGQSTEALGTGKFHGGYGSASLQECLDRLATQMPSAPTALHSGKAKDLILLK